MKLFVKLFAVLVIIAVVAGHFYLGHYLREAIYSGPTEEAIDLNALGELNQVPSNQRLAHGLYIPGEGRRLTVLFHGSGNTIGADSFSSTAESMLHQPDLHPARNPRWPASTDLGRD
ncbi:MAG: hypothetical protein QNJ40_03310 [Xanthomonadales bacterium]|nr:hypothetical protein [Xanthomonadales bacterium]